MTPPVSLRLSCRAFPQVIMKTSLQHSPQAISPSPVGVVWLQETRQCP